MSKDINLSDASMAAMNAIDKISDKRFQELQYVQQCFAWTCYYFQSDVLDKPTTNLSKLGADPRNIYVTDKSDMSFLKFAGQYVTALQFVYFGLNGNPENMDIDTACKTYVQTCDLSTAKLKQDEERTASILAGIKFLNKWNMFKQMLKEVYNIDYSTLEKTNSLYNQLIAKKLQLLESFFKVSAESIKSQNLYIICYASSYASTVLKDEYTKTKEEYLKMLNELYDIVKQSQQLTVCWNNASIQDVSAKNEGIACVDLKQIVNCGNDVVADEIVKDTSNGALDVAKLKQRVDELAGLVDTEAINKKIDEKLAEEMKKIKTSTGVIVCLIILFIICLAALLLGCWNTKQLNDKLKFRNQGGYKIIDDYLLNDFN